MGQVAVKLLPTLRLLWQHDEHGAHSHFYGISTTNSRNKRINSPPNGVCFSLIDKSMHISELIKVAISLISHGHLINNQGG